MKSLSTGIAILASIAIGYGLHAMKLTRWGGAANGELPEAAAVLDAHAGHDHDHDHDSTSEIGHGSESSANENRIVISPQARKSLNLQLGEVSLSTFQRSIAIPGTVIEQPGHYERRVTAAVTGIVSRVFVHPGQAVRPGEKLLQLRLTSEALITTQSALLKVVKEAELVQSELKRLAPLVANGSIPARTKIEKEYELQRLESSRMIYVQELLVRGLNRDQIENIVTDQQLIRELTILVPEFQESAVSESEAIAAGGSGQSSPQSATTTPTTAAHSHQASDGVFTVEQIEVFPGDLVEPGDELCDLAEHTELYLEGRAFEQDEPLLEKILENSQPVAAVFESNPNHAEIRKDLKIRYVDNVLDASTRTLKFYVPLVNEVVKDTVADNGISYRTWKFKPGQKVKLLLPEDQLRDVIVIPAEAVVKDGVDAFVFRVNGNYLERVPISIAAQDPRSIAVAHDGSLFPGDEIAMNQGYMLQLALQKQQGGGVDLHAGHSH